MTKAPSRERFAALRAKYLAARDALLSRESHATYKYGPGWSPYWLNSSERRELERRKAAVGKASDAFFAYLTAISPRDWSYDVPVHWVYEKLSHDDAVRPAGEPLSVVPPLAYGATEPRR